MKNIIKFSILTSLVCVFFLTSCKQSADKARNELLKSEKELTADPLFYSNKVKVEKLYNEYIDFVGKYPSDTAAPNFLFNAANIKMNTNNPDISIKHFEELIKQYPEHKVAASSIFLLGFVYENYKNDLVKAKEMYVQFLTKYPNHPLASSAKGSIDNLGKSPEQLILEFEKKNKQDSALKANEKLIN